jgi:putative ABC transport system substrate-binding protein
MTGDPTPEVQSKRLELLKEAVPRASRAALLWNPSSPGADRYKKMVEDAAIRLGMTLHPVEVRGRDEFEGAFAAMARGGVDALVVLPDPLTFTARSQVVALAAKYRLPAVYHAKEVVEVGGLLSYGVSLEYQFRRAAWYVDRILKGARPADLAVDQATTLELAINLKTAKALGLTIPASLRMRADRVIE